MPHIPRTKQDQELKFSQLIVRTVVFLAAFILLFITLKVLSIPNNKLFISGVGIGTTWIFSFCILLFIWFIYLLFFVKDNSIKKIIKVFKLYGAFSTPKDIGVRYVCFFIILIINLYLSKPGLYSNINALKHSPIFQGEAVLKEKPLVKQSNDKRFLKVYIEANKETYYFQGNAKEMIQLIDKKIDLTVYQGIFTKYALIEK